jgi:PAS domain S-box-containing protein
MFLTIRKARLSHFFLYFYAVLAVLMLLLTPFWALEWYRTPFPGFLLEPNNIVSQINGTGWPGRAAGVAWSDRLMAVDKIPVQSSSEAMSLFKEKGVQPTALSFMRRNGSAYEITITPIHVPFRDLFSLFIVPYLVGVTVLVIGAWAYRIRPDLPSTRAFVIFLFAMTVLTVTFLDMDTTHHVVLLWAMSLPVGVGTFGYLALVFPVEIKFFERRPVFRALPWVMAFVLGYFIVRDIVFPPSPTSYMDSWRWGYILNMLGIILFMISMLVRMLGTSNPVVRQQSRVIVFGSTLAFLPIVFLFVIPIGFGGQAPEFRPEIMFPPLIFLPLSVTYAILRYRLLDVDRWMSRALTYVLTTGVALGAFYAIVTGISLLLRSTIRSDNPLVMALYLLALVVAFNPIRDLIQRGIDRFFYRSHADYRRVLSSLSQRLVVTPDINQTLALLSEELGNALSPEKVLLFLFEDDYKRFRQHGNDGEISHTFTLAEPLPALLRDKNAPLWFPSEAPLPRGLEAGMLLGCEVFVPLIYEGNLIGFLAIGRRLSGEPYSSDDLDFLSTVASQSSLAFENARLFQNLRHTLDETREMKNLMDNIFASIATGVITTDLEHKITLFNRAAENILGMPLESVFGKSLFEALPTLHPELDQVASDVILQGQTSRGHELNSRSVERGELFLRLSASPLKDAYLATKGATLVFENLTETRKVEAERELIRQTFGRIVAPRVRDRLLADAGNLQLHGTRKTVTMLFADLSAFTSFSEKNSPETVFTLLNSYLDIAAQVIMENEGTLDKFMGDAVMAMWNSPDPQADHAVRACRAALEIVRRASDPAQHFPARFSKPEFRLSFRVGVATGPAIVGNVGTSQLFNYTAIGDTVNLAQRLQTSAQPGQIYIQKSTYEIVKNHFTADALDLLTVKGRAQPVEVYLLTGSK